MSKKVTDIDAVELALLRKGTGGVEAVSIDENGEALPNGNSETRYRLVLRSPTRGGEKAQSSRARSLKECKGLRGCEFAECAEKAFGNLPKNLKGLCSTS
ncbi:MAG: hypothetical protein ABSF14_21295 [Terriglobia bacterium]|jgi:hypothetical protein